MENIVNETQNTTEEVEQVVESEVDTTEETTPQVAIEDPENPITAESIEQIGKLLKQVEEMVRIMEAQWNGSKDEFKLIDTHMKQLYQYNESHRTEMPEGLSEEEQDKWDRFNGLDNIPEETVLEIFGEGHPIIGVMHTVTIDRIKDVVNDFFGWMSAMKEYRQIHDAYLQLIELEEEKKINILKLTAEKEEDPEKKIAMEESIKLYYNRKYLEFLAEPMTDEDKNRLAKTFSDAKKIQYLFDRTRTKLKQLNISEKFILEISQFEKRYLPEKYHKCSNIMLLYFMQNIVYADMHDKKGAGRNKVVCMIFGLDGIIRKTWKPEISERIMNNIMAMEDQIIDLLPEPVQEKTEVTSIDNECETNNTNSEEDISEE